MRPIAALAFALAGLSGQPASAADAVAEPVLERPAALDHAIFGFAGRYTRNPLGESFNPFGVDYDDLAAVGLGYQQFLTELPLNTRFGYEVGVAGRFAGSDALTSGATGELWGGGLLRYDGVSLFDTVRVAASFTFGLSAVTDSAGYERQREINKNGDASVLFYFGPEVSLSLEDRRNFEVFARIHHRSGGGEILGGLNEGANAPSLGLRFFF